VVEDVHISLLLPDVLGIRHVDLQQQWSELRLSVSAMRFLAISC